MKNNVVEYVFDPENPPPLTAAQREELNRLATMDPVDIDLSDIPEITDFSGFVRFRDRHVLRPAKQSTTVRIDADVLAWLATIANVVDVDIEAALAAKYGAGWPGCGQRACTCPDAEKP